MFFRHEMSHKTGGNHGYTVDKLIVGTHWGNYHQDQNWQCNKD